LKEKSYVLNNQPVSPINLKSTSGRTNKYEFKHQTIYNAKSSLYEYGVYVYDQNELPLVDRLLDLYRNLFSDGTEGRNDAGPFGVGQSTNDARAMQGEFAHLALNVIVSKGPEFAADYTTLFNEVHTSKNIAAMVNILLTTQTISKNHADRRPHRYENFQTRKKFTCKR